MGSKKLSHITPHVSDETSVLLAHKVIRGITREKHPLNRKKKKKINLDELTMVG